MRSSFRCWLLLLLLAAGMPSAAWGHFLWIRFPAVDSSHPAGTPQTTLLGHLFFSEGADVDTDILPDSIAACEVFVRTSEGSRTPLPTVRKEIKGNVCLEVRAEAGDGIVLETACHYGRHKDFVLDYCAKGMAISSPDQLRSIARSPELALDLVPDCHGKELSVTLLKGDEPLAQVEMTVTSPKGDPAKLTTDDAGRITLPLSEAGLYSFRANSNQPIDPSAASSPEAQGATTRRTYITLTLEILPGCLDGGNRAAETDTTLQSTTNPPCPPLPEAIASFGAAVIDNYLYVYGGHTGKEHAHSRDNLSRHFRRVRIQENSDWEELPMEEPLQGLPLVGAHGRIYRIGGLKALNAPGEDEDLHSVADAAYFDIKTKTWHSLPSLPNGRSSHDAVVVGQTLYVVGGWLLEGSSPGNWHETMLALDLSQENPEWKEIRDVPFQRRALTVAARGNQLFVIGGMNADDEVDNSVDVYDITMSSWAPGPRLPGANMDAFGVSAWTMNDQLYVAGMSGILHRLSADGQSWESCAQLREGRFFHRLLPLGPDQLMIVGGATRKGHLTGIETIAVAP